MEASTESARYLYSGDKVILETDLAGNTKAVNIYGMNLISRTDNGTKLYYLYNAHADVTGLADSGGNITATYRYDAFGNITNKTGETSNPYTYAGYRYDEESDLYYLNARFLTVDTYKGRLNDPLSLNLYTYCVNNPIKYYDSTGHRIVRKNARENAGSEKIHSTVRYGSRGKNVVKLQSKLKNLGYDVGSVDGRFGPRTKKALKEFQRDNGLVSDGIAGSRTWGKVYSNPRSKVKERVSETNTNRAHIDNKKNTNKINRSNAFNIYKAYYTYRSYESNLYVNANSKDKGNKSKDKGNKRNNKDDVFDTSYETGKIEFEVMRFDYSDGSIYSKQYKLYDAAEEDEIQKITIQVGKQTGKTLEYTLISGLYRRYKYGRASYQSYLAKNLPPEQSGIAFDVSVGEVIGAVGSSAIKGAQYLDEGIKGMRKTDFYVKPNGDAVPATGYRYMDTKYAEQTFKTNKAPGSYFGFDKFDSASEARNALQISTDWSNAGLRGEFDTLQIIDDIRIPYEYGDTGKILEPFTKSYPEFGTGGHRQVITDSWIEFKPGGLKLLDK